MATFQLPDFGILLDCHPKTMDGLPKQALAMNLDDSVIEDMIKAVQDGQNIELSTGSSPTISYGSHSEAVTPTPEPFLFDLFVTRPQESLRKAAKYPNPTMSILKTKGVPNGPIRVEKVPMDKNRPGASKAAAPSKPKATNKHLSGTSAASSSAPRSLPASPLSVAGSPALNPTLSASQQAVSRAKEQRFQIVHELAVREQTEDYLSRKWKGAKDDFKPTLEKAADYNPGSNTWALKKNIWKELDVYKYEYGSSEDRQQAIDNAVKQYDRIRLSSTDPEWQRLLPYEDRGKGICLSKLQAEIAKASAAPKIKVQKAEGSQESGASTDEHKTETKPPAKAKGNNIFNGGGTTTKKKAAPKPRAKATTAKSAAKPGTKERPKVLSQAYITNSDDDGSEDEPLSKARTKTPSTASAPVQKAVKVPSPKPKPLSAIPPKPSAGAPKSNKRSLDEDDSSSSSGAPLSKRHHKQAPVKDPTPSVIRAPINKATTSSSIKKPHRPSDASSHSRGTSNSISTAGPAPKATKTTSPTKSSPLASSPPTNASDIDGEGETPPPPPIQKHFTHSRVGSVNSVAGKKRGHDGDDFRERSKRQRVPNNVMQLANKFKEDYQRYQTLHYELKDLEEPPLSKINNLLELRGKLESMKKEIYQGVGDRGD